MSPLLETPTPQLSVGRLVSVTRRVEPVALLAFVAHGLGQARFYWENAREAIAFAGVGTALDLTAWGDDRWEQMNASVRAVFRQAVIDTPDPAVGPRLFGGFAFRDDFVPDNTWADFAPAQLILPHYQLLRNGDQYYLTINAHSAPTDNPDELLVALREALDTKAATLQHLDPPLPAHLSPTEVVYPMSHAEWDTMICAATTRIQRGDLSKVVLARVAELRFAQRVNVDGALAFLAQTYAETYRFLFEPRPHVAFYGATPELLLEVQGRRLRTMGLAGSAPRGQTEAEDAVYASELLHDPKNVHEHQIVVNRIQANLQPLVQQLQVGAMDVLALSNIQHLYTPIAGTLARAQGILSILAHLHPTPALGGEPRQTAVTLISELEPVPRGWFGAPVGWVDADNGGQFAVAIRSAIAQEKRVWLYAGCGIVADSDPQKEWDETALKFRPMLNALAVQSEVLSES